MSQYNFLKMQEKLQKKLDQQRYWHTLGVSFTCASLAMVHGCNMEQAQVAGLLHDCAKCIPNEQKLKLCEKHDVDITDFERKHPFLIHAKLGAYLARKKYHIEDPAVLAAIRCHTTGKPDMNMLEKILYVADYIEPNRDQAPRLPFLRKLAFEDLDQCVYEILYDSLQYLKHKPLDIDEMTAVAYQYYKKQCTHKDGGKK